jgi:hypothetical protein
MNEPFDVREFDNIEDAFDEMRRATDAANAVLHDKQRAVTWGDCWVRFWDPSDGIVIFGRVLTEDELRESELRGLNPNSTDPDERMEYEATVDSLTRMKESHEDGGYLFSWCSSRIEPGEYGSTHRANLWPCSRMLYDAAQEVGWQIGALPATAQAILEAAYHDYRDWYLSIRDRMVP